MKGLFYGVVTGYTVHTFSKAIHDRMLSNETKNKIRSILQIPQKHAVFSRNTAFLSVMAGGALGSFLMATTTGKNEVHELHDIFHINEQKKNTKTPYQQVVEDDINSNDPKHRRQRRLSRRKTLSHRLEQGRGLSDSYGGNWVEEDEDETSMTKRKDNH